MSAPTLQSTNPLQVLLVEDQEDFACLVGDILTSATVPKVAITHLSSLQAARERLAVARFDAVILDLNLPDSRGLNTCSTINAVAPGVPIVVLTGLDDEKTALQSVGLGAQDYVVKGRFDWSTLHRIVLQAMERKRLDLALRESGEFFRLISESISDLIVVLDLQGRRLYNSPSYRKLLGDPERLAGTDSFAEVHPEDRVRIRQLFADTVRTGIGHGAEYRMILPDGTVRHIESRGNVIRDSNGQILRVVVVSRDVTEHRTAVERLHHALAEVNRSHELLKAAQEQLVQTEKLHAVTAFAAGVAHEVMNPLQAISLGIDFLSHFRTSDSTNADKVLTEMTSAIQRADAVIRGLIDFSAFQRPEARLTQINDVVRIALATVDNEFRQLLIELRFSPGPDLPRVRLEEKTFRHVLINLFMHSMATMPGGGRLQVTTRLRPAPGPGDPWPFHSDQSAVEIEIEDSGAAIAGDRHLPLTAQGNDRPETPRPMALSLGVLKRVIELSGGALRVTSEPGYGNRFVLQFPVSPQPEP